MITTRFAEERGRADFGWLDSRHSFSFGDYMDPAHMGFGPLRVINEDRVQPDTGFPTHGHADMEIITYIVEGALEHRDSTGSGSVIRRGDVQRMSAGTGIHHSEFNASMTDPVHLLQIWILPGERGLAPGYEEKRFEDADKRGRWRLVAAPDGRDGALTVHQDVSLYAAVLEDGDRVTHATDPARKVWLQVVQGTVEVNGASARAGDGLAVTGESEITVMAKSAAELLLFDMVA